MSQIINDTVKFIVNNCVAKSVVKYNICVIKYVLGKLNDKYNEGDFNLYIDIEYASNVCIKRGCLAYKGGVEQCSLRTNLLLKIKLCKIGKKKKFKITFLMKIIQFNK